MPRERRIPNAWGQPGVSSVHVDTAEVDPEETPWPGDAAREVEDGDAVVCVDTFMCDTTLTPDRADELAGLLQRAAARARRVQAGELKLPGSTG